MDPNHISAIKVYEQALLDIVDPERIAEAQIAIEGYRRALQAKHDSEVEELRTTSITDPLTGILNRRALETGAVRQRRHTSNEDTPLEPRKRAVETLGWCVLVLDLDGFKPINDTFGHDQGDRILRYFAIALDRSIRPDDDEIYRTGGDEFSCILRIFNGSDFSLKGQIDERLKDNIDYIQTPEAASELPEDLQVSDVDRLTLPNVSWTIGEKIVQGPRINRIQVLEGLKEADIDMLSRKDPSLRNQKVSFS